MKGKKILIIDDEDDFKVVMHSVFEKYGFQVFDAGNISEGLKILNEENPDILFLDNKLPDGYGWGTIEFIRTNYPNVELNLISAYDVPKTSTSLFRIIEKPIVMDELFALLDVKRDVDISA